VKFREVIGVVLALIGLVMGLAAVSRYLIAGDLGDHSHCHWIGDCELGWKIRSTDMLYVNNADKRVSSGIEDRIDHFLRCGSERDIFATMDFVMLACK
jgi:hypothetical protein